jgi:hypothetical protein
MPVTEIERLSSLVERLKNCRTDLDRIQLLDQDPRVKEWMQAASPLRTLTAELSQEWELTLKSLVAIGQEKSIFSSSSESFAISEKIRKALEELFPVESFYKEIGGIVGYHWTLLSFLTEEKKPRSDLESYYRPPGIDISSENERVLAYLLEGILSLPFLAEIYPIGGAADRLKLFDPASGEPLPAAKLEFCGHSLLEGLIRDIQAREYLYFKLFNVQITTPIAMMTSTEKDNHAHVFSLCEEKKWFGRPKESFRFFCQPVVPTMDKEGKWCLSGEMRLLMKPGGHGVLWRGADQNGIFDWFAGLARKKILVRQINNPIAGIDYGLLAFCGVGFSENKIFGFASCPRQLQSAEGVNILIEKRSKSGHFYRLSNVEYCDFTKFCIEDVPIDPGSPYSQFPSNTNILFADIAAVADAARRCPIPGMLVNLKTLSYVDEEGKVKTQEVARLESTMQNIADCFEEAASSQNEVDLKTYLTYNHRRKTISATKKLHQQGSPLLETPEGCFYDLHQNAYDLLAHYCGVAVPEAADVETYTQDGPSFLFQYHPALGPLFSIIAQKIRGGKFNDRSELKLEIAEADISELNLSGSLHILADRIVGELDSKGLLHYSENVGRCRLAHVTVENRGIDAQSPHIYWKGEIKRFELCEIVLHGDAEFHAENVSLRGDLRIEVEAGTRLTAFEEEGHLKFRREILSGKSWDYSLGRDGRIHLK